MAKQSPVEWASHKLQNGWSDFEQEQFAKAEAKFRAAEQRLRPLVKRRGKVQVDPDALEVWVWAKTAVASAARARGRYAVAERCLAAAEAVALEHLGPKHACLATVLNERGILSKYQGRFVEAEAAYRKALPILKCHEGEHSEGMATLLHNLGGIAHAQGHYARAERYARKGLAIRLALKPRRQDLAFASDQSALAAILDVRAKRDEAAVLLASALKVFKRKLGVESFEVGVTLETLGNLHFRNGETKRAEKHLAQALRLQEKQLGKRHPELAFSLHNLAVVYLELNQPERAQPLLVHALRTFTTSLGARHAYTNKVRERLNGLTPTRKSPRT